MAEWTKAAVLKTAVPSGTVGSNPTPSAIRFCGCSFRHKLIASAKNSSGGRFHHSNQKTFAEVEILAVCPDGWLHETKPLTGIFLPVDGKPDELLRLDSFGNRGTDVRGFYRFHTATRDIRGKNAGIQGFRNRVLDGIGGGRLIEAVLQHHRG